MTRFLTLVLSLVFLTSFPACEKSKLEKEQELLELYLLENDVTTTPTSSGLYYIEILKGKGPPANGGDKVKVKYRGTLIDGEEFDTGTHTFFLGYGMVIPGWDEGIKYMNQGGKARLIIPSHMAYGPDGKRSIPGYSTLIFDVELIDIL